MKQRSLSILLVMAAVTAILGGCQGMSISDSPGAPGGSTMRFVGTGGQDSWATASSEAGSTFLFRPLLHSGGQEDIMTAIDAGVAADSGATLRFR